MDIELNWRGSESEFSDPGRIHTGPYLRAAVFWLKLGYEKDTNKQAQIFFCMHIMLVCPGRELKRGPTCRHAGALTNGIYCTPHQN